VRHGFVQGMRFGLAYSSEECFDRVLVGLRVSIPRLSVIDTVHTLVGDEIGVGLREGVTRS
jgi:hypothetical protein